MVRLLLINYCCLGCCEPPPPIPWTPIYAPNTPSSALVCII